MESRYYHFTTLILGIRKLINKIKDSEMAELGLKGVHLTCMFYISEIQKEKSEVTATDICKYSGEDKAAVSRILGELEKSGMIVVEQTDKKKYKSKLVLTSAGKSVEKNISKKIEEYENIASKDLTESERKSLYTSLESILKNLAKLTK